MTRKRRIFRGLFLALGISAVGYAGYRVLERRDLSGSWTGDVQEYKPAGGGIAWRGTISLWKESGRWTGSFHREDWHLRRQVCAGGLELVSSGKDGHLFREHPSTCGTGGTLRVKRLWSGLRVWGPRPGAAPENLPNVLHRLDFPDEPRWRVTGAEPALRVGGTVRGELAPPDPEARAVGWIDTYRYLGEPGKPVVLVLRSDEFVPQLDWRAQMGGRWFQPRDPGAQERPSPSELRITVVPDERAAYYGIVVNTNRSVHDRPYPEKTLKSGAYTLSIDPAPHSGAWVEPDSTPFVRAGERVRGELRQDGPRGANYHADYVYRGRAGELLRAVVVSDSIDAFVQIGRVRPGGVFVSLRENDDAQGAGTNAVTELRLPEDGPYVVRASMTPWYPGGPFELRVTSR